MFPRLLVEEPMQEYFIKQWSFIIEESGYLHIQATKPDTVGKYKKYIRVDHLYILIEIRTISLFQKLGYPHLTF